MNTTNLKLKKTLQIVFIALYVGFLITIELMFAAIPNVEFVTFFLLMSSVIYNWRICFTIINAFIILNISLFGIGDYLILYFIVFNLFSLITMSLKNVIKNNWFIFVVICSISGFLFGIIDASIKYFLYDESMFWAYFIKGIPFDIIHGISNFIISILLFQKIKEILYTNTYFLQGEKLNYG